LLIQRPSRNRYKAAGDLRELFIRRASFFSTGSNMGESVGVAARLLLAHTVVNIASNRMELPDVKAGWICTLWRRFEICTPLLGCGGEFA
jgi:hypothetical protein